uniref:Cytochrome P450 n=1 Tax=Globisporangium ultimum (strain ATCC 200006 / CBS 805.95 / DAOM BR144) TaxID=431595 RepID=K3WMR2_GLOUD
MLSIGQLVFAGAALSFVAVVVPISILVLVLVYGKLVTAKGKAPRFETLYNGSRKVWRLDTAIPFFEDTLELAKHVDDFQDYTASHVKQFNGEPYIVKVLGRPDSTVLSTPQAIEDVLKNEFECFPKGPFVNEGVRELLGEGIFGVDDAKWVHQRKTASNLFTKRALRDSMTTIVQTHAKVLHSILQRAADSKTSIDLFRLFNRFSIEVFSQIAFGIHLGCLDADEEHPFQTAFDSAQRQIVLRFARPSWFWKAQRWLGVGAEGILKENIKRIDDMVLEIIATSLHHRHNNGALTTQQQNGEKDIVSLFLDNVSQNPDFEAKDFDPRYLRDIVVNFLIAGRDTTAQSLSWLFYNLSSRPDVVAKVRAEIATKLPAFVSGEVTEISMEQSKELVYLEACLKESLRLHPTLPFGTKHVKHDVVLSDGTFIKANTTVGLAFYGMARLERVWGPNAESFNPDRWIDPDTGKLISVSSYKFTSFSAGPRMCLGMNLAMLEMKLVVSGLLSKFDVELVPGQKITYDFSLTLPVRGAMMANVTRVW